MSVKNDEIVFGFESEQNDSGVAEDYKRCGHRQRHWQVLSMKKSPHKYKKTSLKISLLQLSGHGQVTNISLSNEEHLRMFFHGANWFMRNQDKSGGWPSLVLFNKDQKKYPKADELAPGWYGAMFQARPYLFWSGLSSPLETRSILQLLRGLWVSSM